MTKYLCHVKYTAEGMKGLLAEGGSRRKEAVKKLTAAAISLIVGSAGGATTSFTVLLTPEEVDAAVKKTLNYRPPGA